MRVLAAGDIHGELSVYEWLLNVTGQIEADVLVFAGDLLSFDSEERQTVQAAKIVSLIETISIPVLYIMGNDDLVSLNYETDRIKPLHNRCVPLDKYKFVGYQYSLPFMGGVFEKPESEIQSDMQLLEPLLGRDTVFVSHSPIHGFLDTVPEVVGLSDGHAGSRSMGAMLNRKSVLAHIHGHVHGAFGRQGNHFNVAAAATRRAIWLDLPSLAYGVVGTKP